MSHSSPNPHRTYPADVLEAIAAAVYAAALPPNTPSLDPLYSLSPEHNSVPPNASPSTYPTAYWSEPTSRKTLATLCLVSKDFKEAAGPWLWRRLEINIPRNWLGILDAVCGQDDEPDKPISIASVLTDGRPQVPCSHITATAAAQVNENDVMTIPSSFPPAAAELPSGAALPSGLGPIPRDLLTPPSSRDPSPARLRLRAASPGRWRFIKAVNKIVHRSGLYVPTPDDPSPGRHVRHLDFNHFRTIGLRRSVGDGFNARFVTDVRLERLLKEMPNLKAFGATEFMDSAISAGVLAELVLRGSPVPPEMRRPARRGRGVQHSRAAESDSDEDSDGGEVDEAERRAAAKPLEALDFCGCVSSVFVGALHAFVRNEGLLRVPGDKPPQRTFTGLRRLGLRGVTSVPSSTLSALVLSFPNLTHLDLTGTLCTPDLLEGLSAQASNSDRGRGMRLKSLALGRCMRLTSTAIARFITGPAYDTIIVDSDGQTPQPYPSFSGVCDELEELALYGDTLFPTPLSEEDLYFIVSAAPCFTANAANMSYLDLSSCPVTPRILQRAFANAGASGLRSLGLSHIPTLPLSPLITFIASRAPHVEVLTLVGSCTAELSTETFGGTGRVGEVALALTVRSKLLDPLCSLPFRIRREAEEEGDPPTRLRVLEFSNSLLKLLPPGAGPSPRFSSSNNVSVCLPGSPAWTTVRSRGGRAWYVDASACWVNGRFVRGSTSPKNAAKVEPVQQEIVKLAAIGMGAASGDVGWHAHKMEILHGLGMLGREDGLYGAVSFAYTSG